MEYFVEDLYMWCNGTGRLTPNHAKKDSWATEKDHPVLKNRVPS